VYPADHPPSHLELLRAICERQGVAPTDADLEAVRGFVDRVVPALAEIERRLPRDTTPAT
jgi:hypothetical protein